MNQEFTNQELVVGARVGGLLARLSKEVSMMRGNESGRERRGKAAGDDGRFVIAAVVVVLTVSVLTISCKSTTPPAPGAASPSAVAQSLVDTGAVEQMIASPEASQKAQTSDKGNYAWQLFLYFNSPLTGPAQKYWESNFRQTSTVYLPDGCLPPPWGQAAALPAEAQAQISSLPNWGVSAGVWHNLDTAIQVDGLVLLDEWSQDVRYQLLMNRQAFDYIVQRGFYNVNGQEAAARNGQPADFPPPSFELKTSWIWIGTDQAKFDALNGKYYIAPAYFEVVNNGKHVGWQVGYAALSGMHLINKSLPDWVWITFENVNNPNFTRVKLEVPTPAYAQQANQRYQPLLRDIGSVFANYQLDGVQLGFSDPTLLANSNIESAFQHQSSCITCHSLASITGSGAYFNIVNKSGGNVGYFTGSPPATTGYTKLDFVWSMKRASRAKNCPPQEK